MGGRMTITAPFDLACSELVTQAHEQTFRAEATTAGGTIPLEVIDYAVDWSETRTPRVQATIDVTLPDDQAVLEQLDPRTFVRVRLIAGYRLASGALDEHQVADLGLRRREVHRSGDGPHYMTLALASDEVAFLEALTPVPGDGEATFAASSFRAAVAQYLVDAFTGTPYAGAAVVNEAPETDPIDVPLAAHPWDALSDFADQFDFNLFDNGDRVWRIAPRRSVAANSVLSLAVGSNGTLLRSGTGVDREDWANWVTIVWQWTDAAGAQQSSTGLASVTGGPFSVASSGYRILYETRNIKGASTSSARNRTAATVLQRMLNRARSYTVEAVPAWWVRPDHTITLQLPLGDQERHIVSAVGFRPGAMTIETRLPDNASTIGE